MCETMADTTYPHGRALLLRCGTYHGRDVLHFTLFERVDVLTKGMRLEYIVVGFAAEGAPRLDRRDW